MGQARRITILASTSDWGGTEEVTLGLLEALERRGHSTALVDLRLPVYDPALRAAGLRTTYRYVPLPKRLNKLSTDGYEHLLRDLATDVCVLSKGAFSVRASHLDEAAGGAARRYVIIEHLVAGPMRSAPPRKIGVPVTLNPLWYWRQRRVRMHLKAADAVVCVSAAVRERLTAEFGDEWPAVVVHNGVDTEAFRFAPEGRRRMRDQCAIPQDAFVFGFMARLAYVKAPDVAMEQFASLLTGGVGSAPFLIVAGDGPDRAALEARAAALGIAKQVRFVGWISRAARVEVLSAFDSFLLPSRAEGLPLALLEAMAVQRSCVAFDVGGVGEVLSDASVGWLVPHGDVAAFGRAMGQCIAMTNVARERLGAFARAHVERSFDRTRQLEILTDVVLGE